MGDLAVGMRVEARGKEVDGVPVVDELERKKPRKSSRPDSATIDAPVAAPGWRGKNLALLGNEFASNSETKFRDHRQTSKNARDIDAGEWVRLQARERDGRLAIRGVRPINPRPYFEVDGLITEIDPDHRSLRVGPLPMRLSPDPQIVDREWSQRNNPLALLQADEQKSMLFTIPLSQNVLLGGQASVTFSTRRDYDLDESDEDDREDSNVSSRLSVLWRFDEAGSFTLIEGDLGRRDRFRDGRETRERHEAEINRAYAYYKLNDMLRLQVGRQDFQDDREWLYDRRLDGARLRALSGDLEIETGFAWGRELLAEDNSTERTFLLTALASYSLDDDHVVSAYVLHREDSTSDDFEPTLFGVRSFARPSTGFGHWAELSRATGKDGRRDISGYAVDLGVTYRIDRPLRPTLVFGFARGSGKEESRTAIGYRQSGLQDNNGKFGGITRFRYYGEVLDPELANLSLSTIGFGFRPVSDVSVDLVQHWYWQHVATDDLINANVRADPNGQSRNLGWGLDAIVGFRSGSWLRAEIVGGLFEPGPAFDEQDTAFRFAIQARFRF